MPRTYQQRHWQCNIRSGESYIHMWPVVVILLLLCSNRGVAQIFEGSGGDSGPTRELRFVESANDEQIITTNEATCVSRQFSGNGFRFKGTFYNEMFICPNGLIKLNDDIYQNWPFNFGTLEGQSEDISFAPYWSRVDLNAFGTSASDSKVRFASYHKDTNPRQVVFDKVNDDVRAFTGGNDFQATWVSVVTYENIRPHDRVQRGYEGKNTFQVVFASNETSWYLMYNYDDIDWAVAVPKSQYGEFVNTAGLPVIGWNAGRRGFFYRNNEEYFNLPLSGTVNAEEIDDYQGNLGIGRWIFATSPRTERSPGLLCYDWFVTSPVLTTSGRRRFQCPRFETQAAFDRRFQRQDKFGRICYVRRFPRFQPIGLRCCFRRFGGPLLRNLPEPGGFLSSNPLFSNDEEDDRAFENCCVLSDFCWAYFAKRPKQNGRFYRPRRFAVGYGDPHYSNLDNMNYTYNGCGDFTFVISNDNQFQVQVRFSRAAGAGLGTVVSAVVLKVADVDPIQINHNKNENGPAMLLHINGAQYSDYDNLDTNAAVIGDKVSIARVGNNRLELVTDADHTVVVTRETNNLVVVLALDDSLFGLTTGLMGNWSNSLEDDFVLPNGTNLGYPLTDEQIHFDFGENWRLTPEQNLFVNTTADGDFFCPDDYAPIFVSNFTFPNSSVQQTAARICAGNIICEFDYVATMLESFAQDTIDSFNVFEEEKTIAENNAPTFENSNVVFNLTVGEEFVYTFRVEDADGDNLEFTNTDLPPGATVERSGNNITFRWHVNTTQPFNVSFTVQDTKNGSTTIVPMINVCACENGGLCVQPATTMETQGLLFSQHQVLSCDCATGYIGQFCEIVRDFCQRQSGSPCHPLANCTNSPTNFTCSGCPSGYSGDGADCADIDECTDAATHGCEMMCINNAGSFVCECMDGYELNDDMKTCSDINECRRAHDCEQNCTNTLGSFSCGCNENFIVDSMNSKNCVPRLPCPSGNPCQQVCAIDSSGQQVCSCNRGYTIDPNIATNCVDVDECQDPTNLCSQLCNNTIGSFNCSCVSGYVLGDDRFTCEDVDECIMAEMLACNTSNGGEVCVNRPGSFRCECNSNLGFVLIDGICQVPDNNQVVVVQPEEPPPATQADMDSSVQLRLLNFQSNMYDRPTDIAFRSSIADALNRYCSANDQRRTDCGLAGRGILFSELNIFRLPNQTIQNNDDLLVSYYAVYPDGAQSMNRVPVPRSVLLSALNDRLDAIVASTGVTATVEDIDECQMNIDGCGQFCMNIPGSFVCSCLMGNQLDNDRKTCIDIDECTAQTHNCNNTGSGEICRNIPNSFVCECNRTLDLGLVNGICKALNGSQEPLPESRNATMNQTNNAVEFKIPNFQAEQFGGQTDTQMRAAIAEALNRYCNVNAARRAECGLPASGFVFTEQNVHRIPTDPTQDGSDTSVSYYALYPNGIRNGTDIPVPKPILLEAIKENLDNIRSSTGLDSLSLAEETPSDDEPIDWPLALGLSLAGALFLVMAVGAAWMFCYKSGSKKVYHSRRFVYDAYRHRPSRRLNVADLDPSFGTFHSMSGETYSGFDEDGLPVDIPTEHDGLSRQARTVSHIPTAAGSRASLR